MGDMQLLSLCWKPYKSQKNCSTVAVKLHYLMIKPKGITIPLQHSSKPGVVDVDMGLYTNGFNQNGNLSQPTNRGRDQTWTEEMSGILFYHAKSVCLSSHVHPTCCWWTPFSLVWSMFVVQYITMFVRRTCSRRVSLAETSFVKQPVFVGNISLLKSLWRHTAGCLTNLNTRWNEPNEKVHLRENMRNCPQLTVLNSRMPNWHPNFCWPKTMATGTCFKPPRRDLEQRWTVADLVATCRSRRYGYGRNLKPLWFHQKTWGFNKHQ